MLRSVRDLEGLIQSGPFTGVSPTRDVKLYVAFLSRKPTIQPTLPLISSKEALEATRMNGREVCIVSRPRNNGFFGLPNNFIEEQLGVSATTRNWSTIAKIINETRKADG